VRDYTDYEHDQAQQAVCENCDKANKCQNYCAELDHLVEQELKANETHIG
jgi:hypothetical protein